MSVIASCPLRTPTLAHRLSLQNQQPKRRISNYLSDVLRTGSLNPSNPILETFETIYPKKTEQADETEASASETTTTTTAKSFHNRIPHFSVWQPHHLLDAAPKLENQYSDDVASFKAKLSDTSSTHSLKEIVSDWDRIHSPIKYVHNASFVLGLLSDASLHKDWKIALGEISKTLPNPMNEALLDQYEDKEILSLFYASLKEGMEKLDSNTNSNEDWMWAALHWKNVIRKRTGLGLTPDQRETFHTNLDAMDALEGRMVAHSNPSKEQLGQLLSDGYSILDLRKQNAKLLGYKDFVEQTLDSRMAKNAGEIQSLHETIADRVLPVVETVPYDPFDPQFFKPGEIHNVTFDGALTALSKLVYNLFGVEIRKEDQPKERDLAVWNKDVWLLHLIDHENKEEDGEPSYLGSIFLDPFKRPAKLRRSFLAPLVDRGFMNEPLVAISLEISPPVWDDQPAEMQWEDTETLWHEFGHALQTILAKSSLGRVCGGHNLPLDMSEVMPKFMEHCLFDEQVLTTIMDCSEKDQALTPEMIEKLHVWRNQRKVKQIMQHIFFGSFELELFSSSFDPKEESLVGLQRRIATRYIPHDMPPQKDFSPFVDIINENARGTHIAFYRYLWAEVYSAGLRKSLPGDLMNDSADVRKVGIEFRRTFLDPGAPSDPEVALRKFDGQATEAMLDLFQI